MINLFHTFSSLLHRNIICHEPISSCCHIPFQMLQFLSIELMKLSLINWNVDLTFWLLTRGIKTEEKTKCWMRESPECQQRVLQTQRIQLWTTRILQTDRATRYVSQNLANWCRNNLYDKSRTNRTNGVRDLQRITKLRIQPRPVDRRRCNPQADRRRVCW